MAKSKVELNDKLWKKLNTIAKKKFGEFGFSTLTEEQMKEAILIATKTK